MTPALGRHAAAALRAQPRPRAELQSQLLFGEPVQLLEREGDYHRVRCCDDDFEGYVRSDQLLPTDAETYRQQCDAPAFVLDLYTTLLGDRHAIPVTFGARLPQFDGLRLRHAGDAFGFTGQAVLTESLTDDAERFLRFARRWLYVPELRGGRTPTGIDPAALIQLVGRLVNLRLPRTPEALSRRGRPVDFVVQCQPGDLAYFDNRRGEINHVGIVLPDSRVLHVYGCVRVDALDHYGVFNYDLGRYTHRLRIVKRLLKDLPTIEQTGLQLERVPLEEVDQAQLAIF